MPWHRSPLPGKQNERGIVLKDRIYVCHTYYHAYIACVKELVLPAEKRGGAALVLSSMSNDFRDLKERAERSGIFGEVITFDEKEDVFFPELAPLKKDTGNILRNMINRIRFCRRFAELEAPFVPVDFRLYKDIYVFCDSDPIGYYLAGNRIPYHAVEDGLDCLRYYDTARYDNRGHFRLKAFMAALGLIFIQNGYSRYCIDMEVNDLSVLPFPVPKAVEARREELAAKLTPDDRERLTRLFIANRGELDVKLDAAAGDGRPTVLVLTEPLCGLETRKRLFADLIRENGTVDGAEGLIVIKPHPRDVLDYAPLFPDAVVLDKFFPMEILNFIDGLMFDRVVTVYTVPSSLHCVKEAVYLGDDFMDRYEAPEIHRQNEQV